MTVKIPHSAVIQSQLDEYLEDALDIVGDSFEAMPDTAGFRAIYKNSVGTFTPLSKIAQRRLPLLKSAAGIVKRCPLLIATRQIQLAYIELRRLIEIVNCYPYFAEHPVEWKSFMESPGEGYSKDQEQPIYWSAHREMRWYSNYIKERYTVDKSGLVARALNDCSASYKTLSAHVHAALDHLTKKPLTKVFDTVSAGTLGSFAESQKRIYRASLVLSLTPHPGALGKLNAIERAWFDYVLGSAQQKKIRAGEFLSD